MELVPLEPEPMSIYSAIFFTFGGIAIGLIVHRLFSAEKRISTLEVNSAETNQIVKNIENKTNHIDEKINTMLIDARELNAEVIKHMIDIDN